MFKILVVEDDKNIRKLICNFLIRDGYEVAEAQDGEKGLNKFENSFFDLIITDIMMPIMDGITFSKNVREINKEIPILILTAKDSLSDKREGFLSGGDDYMVKPIDMEEMLLRVSVLLRRSKIVSEKRLVVGEVEVDYNTNILKKGEFLTELPKKEFLLLYKLLSSPNRIFTRMQIMDEIWGYDNESDDRTVDVHIKRIRERLEQIEDFEIVTVRGLGYKAVVRAR